MRSTPVEAEVAETFARVAESLDPEARDTAVAEGYALAPDAAVAYALGEVIWEEPHEVRSE